MKAVALTLLAVIVACPLTFANPPKKVTLPPALDKQVDFAREVQPLFAARCVRCHGPKKSEGGLRLDRRDRAFAGGNSGPAFLAGKSADSKLIHYVAGVDEDNIMPPSGPRLTAPEIGMLRSWIDQGAKWPADPQTADKVPASASTHWAFQPIQRPAVPAVKQPGWIVNPIDSFILARLEKEKLTPASAADKVTLIRRLSLDLLGLPPTLAEIDAFHGDTQPDAYSRLVERLLASPHYGERWGRHWLDAARYADSDGYNFDGPRSIWKYRDWVIDALNRDLPFDRFVIEQIAGDLLPDATIEQKIATGFHRNTLFNIEGGNDPEEFRVERVNDRVATTGVVFLGLTLGCAECHAHKYDPISQREYYELYSFFNNADEQDLETPTSQEQANRQRHDAEVAKLEAKLKGHAELQKTPRNRAENAVLLTAALLPTTPFLHLANVHAALDPVGARLNKELTQLKAKRPGATRTLIMAALGKPRQTKIHLRGNFRTPGAAVTPNVPRVLPSLPKTAGEHSRLDLARWLVSRDNPLTARVTVNRVWQYYFGKGIVDTENDFGTQGSPPTHPELLDWLAREFMERSWSLKDLHRLIVTSSTYRQASRHRPELESIDPDNRLLARQNRLRLEAEIVRDAVLASAGILSTRIGGPSVFPYQPPGVMETRRSPRPWQVSAGGDSLRRTMYTHFWRTSPHPFLMAFDAPKSDTACTRRQPSNTSLQALILLNDPMFLEAARGLASRVLKEGPSDPSARLKYAFRLCLTRAPNGREHKILLDLLGQQQAEFMKDTAAARRLVGATVPQQVLGEHAAWAAVARVIFNLDEAIVRE